MRRALTNQDPGDEHPYGFCTVCGKPIPKTAARYAEPDGFCSSRHAREFHGTSLAVDVPAERIASSLAGKRLKL